jgi:hypothetical protein
MDDRWALISDLGPSAASASTCGAVECRVDEINQEP